jgi:hypothetical protein
VSLMTGSSGLESGSLGIGCLFIILSMMAKICMKNNSFGSFVKVNFSMIQ